MGLFSRSSNWTDQILVEAKRIWGLPHDATEQEVHEAMRRSQTLTELTAHSAPASVSESPVISPDQADEQPTESAAPVSEATSTGNEPAATSSTATDGDESGVEDLAQEVDTLRATLTAMKTEMDDLRAQMQALSNRMAVVEKMPAAEHSSVSTGTTTTAGSKTPAWDKLKEQYGL